MALMALRQSVHEDSKKIRAVIKQVEEARTPSTYTHLTYGCTIGNSFPDSKRIGHTKRFVF